MSAIRQNRKFIVSHIKDHTPWVRELRLECVEPKEFTFRAGQFVMLHVPDPDAPKPALRAYSLASSEAHKTGFTLLFKFVPNGKASIFVWQLRGGEVLDFTGPFGRVFFEEPPTEQVIFLNTGTGVSQHYSYLESKKEQYPNIDFYLYFGLRNEEEIFFQDELEKLKSQMPRFQYQFVLSQASAYWTGLRGYVQDHLPKHGVWTRPTSIYLCGNGQMIKQTKELLFEKQFDPKRLHFEAFD